MAVISDQKNQPVIDALRRENAELKHENEHLKAENKRLGGGNGTPGTQTRRCVNCKYDLPDGPAFYPGYLEKIGGTSAIEARRHHCVNCR